MTKQQFPDLIKAGLKVGDTVYSYQHGEGKVVSVRTHNQDYPILVDFGIGEISFTKEGKQFETHAIPTITLTHWNPVKGEPFPFPKWQPKEGEWCAFWDNGDGNFIVSKFSRMLNDVFVQEDGGYWQNCAPISEAMRIFGVKEDGNE